MALTTGIKLGTYEITGAIGAGGMGEVYQAHDTKLGRDVAIKVLPEAFAHDPERLSRFQREAKMLAALNHPNIATIYGLEQSNGTSYLVMELVAGETLADRVSAGPLRIAEALAIAGQITEALEAAHEKGIIHRDLKPANVKVTPEGKVKVLDFGLAKAFAGDAANDDPSNSPTLSMAATMHGVILGTAAYMSPEQARGKAVDKRTDIWAFGCLLYELLAGRKAFRGETLTDTLADILEREPDWQALPATTPAKIRDLLRRCMEKDTQRRLRDLGDARLEIEEALAVTREQRRAARTKRAVDSLRTGRTRRWALAAGGLLTVVTVLTIAVWRIPLRSKTAVSSAPLHIEQITAFVDSATMPALSPDGRMVTFIRGPDTFVTSGQIYLKLLPNGEPVVLTHDANRKMSPVFSPDGSRIAYTVSNDLSWDTWTVPTLGGDARPWLPNASGLSWVGFQRLLFSEVKTGIHMAVVAADESRTEARDVYLPEDLRGMVHRSYLSPDGHWVVVVEMDRTGWLPCRYVPFDGSSKGRTAGPPAGQCTYAAWSPDGHWTYFSSNASGSVQLWRQRFPDGTPEQLTFGPTTAAGIAMAPDGRSLITSMGLSQRSVWLHENGVDRQVSTEGNAVLPAWGDGFPTSVFSRDGRKLYYLVQTGTDHGFGGGELWVKELMTGSNEALLPGLHITSFDISPNGQQVVFSATGADEKSRVWLARLDRRSSPHQLLNDEALGPVFGGDDEVYFRGWEGKLSYIYEVRLDSGQVRKVVQEPAISSPAVSPDGQWVVSSTPFASENSSAIVRAYPTHGGTPVTVCPLCFLKWTRDRRFLFLSFRGGNFTGEGKVFVIALPPGKAFPPFPVAGIKSEADARKLPVVQVINRMDVFPGTTSSVYAFGNEVVQRNLYRIAIP